jgi:hypothetical protein
VLDVRGEGFFEGSAVFRAEIKLQGGAVDAEANWLTRPRFTLAVFEIAGDHSRHVRGHGAPHSKGSGRSRSHDLPTGVATAGR